MQIQIEHSDIFGDVGYTPNISLLLITNVFACFLLQCVSLCRACSEVHLPVCIYTGDSK